MDVVVTTKEPSMRSLTDHLSNYADYHRDRRNIATHFFGIPVIVLAVAALLSRPVIDIGGFPLSPAIGAIAATCVFYFRLDLRFGITMTILMVGAAAFGAVVAALSTSLWLALSLGLFVGGWFVQFVGHWFEGRKPAFVDDLVGLVVGPLFVVAETGFALGLRKDLHAEIERRSGPTRVGRPQTPAAQAQ
jgi:uncharacterized membrane protein YGL010W